MKISTRFYIGFSLILLLIFISGFISYSGLEKSTHPLEHQIQEDISDLSKKLELDKLADLIKYYDEVLTMSARNYAFTSDEKWKQRYNTIVPELDRVVKEAIEKGDLEDKIFFQSIESANLALVDMEEEAILRVSQGEKESAVTILESAEYWDQKEIYNIGLEKYFSKRGSFSTEIVKSSTIGITNTAEDIHRSLDSNLKIALIFFIIILIVGAVVAFLTSRSISKPINHMANVVDEISRGNFNLNLNGSEKINEINKLNHSLNRVIKSMKLAVLEKKEKSVSLKVSKKLLDEAYEENKLRNKGEKMAKQINRKKKTKRRK